MKEAVDALMVWVFEQGASVINAYIEPESVRSIRRLEKSGTRPQDVFGDSGRKYSRER